MNLFRKVKFALGTALSLNGATLIAYLNGTIDGKSALIAAITTDLPVLVAYLTTETKTP